MSRLISTFPSHLFLFIFSNKFSAILIPEVFPHIFRNKTLTSASFTVKNITGHLSLILCFWVTTLTSRKERMLLPSMKHFLWSILLLIQSPKGWYLTSKNQTGHVTLGRRDISCGTCHRQNFLFLLSLPCFAFLLCFTLYFFIGFQPGFCSLLLLKCFLNVKMFFQDDFSRFPLLPIILFPPIMSAAVGTPSLSSVEFLVCSYDGV